MGDKEERQVAGGEGKEATTSWLKLYSDTPDISSKDLMQSAVVKKKVFAKTLFNMSFPLPTDRDGRGQHHYQLFRNANTSGKNLYSSGYF
jgi:hypothetical protein